MSSVPDTLPPVLPCSLLTVTSIHAYGPLPEWGLAAIIFGPWLQPERAMISFLRACLFIPNGKESIQNCFPMITEVLSLKASIPFLGLAIQHRDWWSSSYNGKEISLCVPEAGEWSRASNPNNQEKNYFLGSPLRCSCMHVWTWEWNCHI